MDIKFISYNGQYPYLCCGVVKFSINSIEYTCTIESGGSFYFDENSEKHVITGPWAVNLNSLKEEIRSYSYLIEQLVNKHIKKGCCGGCI